MTARNVQIDESMVEFYRLEAEDQTRILVERLLALERTPSAPDLLEACMRAAHSLKGAARIIRFEAGVKVAHAMEDCFVAAQRGTLMIDRKQIDAFLRDVDILRDPYSGSVEASDPASAMVHPDMSGPQAAAAVDQVLQDSPIDREARTKIGRERATAGESERTQRRSDATSTPAEDADDRMLRVTAQHLDRLLRLAGESLVDARRQKRGEDHAQRLYEAALACRMRPFADGIHGFARMVRDLARSLGKSVRLEIRGQTTQVDRDILSRLEAPLGHLLRNAVDHGIEGGEERRANAKPEEGVITLEARHNSGTLQVSVSDDGRGIVLERIRRAVIERGLAAPTSVANLGDAELLEFLFLPGFTLKNAVTDVSGRGVGLDAVREVVHNVNGKVRVTTQEGRGTRFQLQLPLTLSVQRTLLVEIANEPYALPLANVARTARVARDRIEYLEGHPHYHDGARAIGLVSARQLLSARPADLGAEQLDVVLIGSQERTYGLLVDRFLGERELVVRVLDSRLGKIEDVAAAAVMEDGEPVLILDVEDLTRSMERVLRESGSVRRSPTDSSPSGQPAHCRILVVDDSLTVRELQRKLLVQNGYQVDTAIDGVDGWNTAKNGKYDLIITDLDMPRMDGIELITRIKNDPHLKATPVMIVSYKDRQEDRRRGLDAGADYYLAKGSFHDDALLEAVRDLVGEAVAAGVPS